MSITRRDFLNGVGVAITGSLVAPPWLDAFNGATQDYAPEKLPGYYPPALTGLRGSHAGSFEVGHELRDGKSWDEGGTDVETGETYDLVVVGAGLSGLSAAYFYREMAGRDRRILILDNHDDFGGHAKRNEFTHRGRMLLLNGGTLELESPSRYSQTAKGLLAALGVDVARFDAGHASEKDLYESLKLQRAMFFDRETFGADKLVPGLGHLAWPEFLARTPLSEGARRDIARLYDASAKTDYMPGVSSAEKKARLARISYRDFLLNHAKVQADVLPFFQARPHGLFCLGIDALPALYGWQMEYPGFQGMGLEPTPAAALKDQPGGQHGRQPESDERSVHLPDGNATLARLLVGSLVPSAFAARSMEQAAAARVNYARLDDRNSSVRVRLNSTVVRVKHDGDPSMTREVAITYVRGGKARRVRANACVMACWNTLIPHLCPELPDAQKEALAYGVKAPIVYTSVLIRDWTAFAKLGVSDISAPGSYHTAVSLSDPASLGDYRSPQTPAEPMVLHLVRTPCSPGLSKKEQHRMGRLDLLSTTFETFERNIGDQLGRMLTGGGFDPGRDIEAITVNRWPHGYAYTYNSLFDPPEWALGTPDDRPCVIARKPFGRIAIANSDSAASPHTDAAIDMAYRAVQEIAALKT